jgi:hypothetical protein
MHGFSAKHHCDTLDWIHRGPENYASIKEFLVRDCVTISANEDGQTLIVIASNQMMFVKKSA